MVNEKIGRVEQTGVESDPEAAKRAVHDEIARTRASAGVKPVKNSPYLQRIVQQQAYLLQGGYPEDARSLSERAKGAAYDGEVLFELIGKGTIQVLEITDAWVRDHRQELIQPASDIAVGVGGSANGWIIVMALGLRTATDGSPQIHPQMPIVEELPICLPEKFSMFPADPPQY